jgi:hypothetical protein
MTSPETGDHLSHHLTLAGGADQLFSDDDAALIHQTSRGLPRAVNNIALQALVVTYATNKTIVEQAVIRAAVAEVTAVRSRTDHDDTANNRPSTRPSTSRPDTWDGALTIR